MLFGVMMYLNLLLYTIVSSKFMGILNNIRPPLQIPKLPEPKPIPPIDQLPWYTSANALLDRRDWMEEDETDPRTTGERRAI